MRAMIVAAGLGTRLRPLTDLCPKAAVPVRGLPLISYSLALLAHHGVDEVVVNVHHLPEVLEQAARRHCPGSSELFFSPEPTLLDTGGGVRKAASFLPFPIRSLEDNKENLRQMDDQVLNFYQKDRRR